MRIAIIGCGKIGRRHAGWLKQFPDVKVVACQDTVREAADGLAKEWSAATCAQLDEVWTHKPDAVIVASPPAAHSSAVRAAAEHGAAVLCEKPLADRLANCAGIPRDARIMCAFKFRFLSGAARMRDLIAAGELGQILSIRGMAISNLDMSKSWFARPELSGGGVLLDNGVHLVDLCRYLLGDVDSACGLTSTSTRGLPVEESGAALLKMASGTMVHILTSWEMPAPMPPLIEIHGSKAFVRLGNETEVFDAAGKERKIHITGEGVDIWRAVIANFVAYLKGEAAPHATLADGFAAQAAIEAAYRSMTSARWERPAAIQEVIR